MTSEQEKGNHPGPGNYGQADHNQWLSLAAASMPALAQNGAPLPALAQNGVSLPALAQNGGLAGLLNGRYGLTSAPAPPISLRDNGFSSAPPGMNFPTNDFNGNNKSVQQQVPAPNNNSGASYISSEILALLASSLRQQQQQQQPMQPSHPNLGALRQQQQPMQPSHPNLGGGNTFMHNNLNPHTNNHQLPGHQLPGVPWGTDQIMSSSLDPSAIFAPNMRDSSGNNAAALLNSLIPQRQQLPQQLSLQQEHQYHQPPALTTSAPPPRHEEAFKPGLAHRDPILLFMDCDDDSLSEYQCFLRQQIEAFEAGLDDVKGTAQGRNTPIQLGQVGIRCRHCASLPKAARPRGAVYYSQKIEGVYQVAQNMSKVHILGRCSQVPDHVKRKLLELKQVNQRASGGKDYWGDGLRALGIYEDGRCMRFQPRTVSASPPGQK
jgi:hypothetical protein